MNCQSSMQSLVSTPCCIDLLGDIREYCRDVVCKMGEDAREIVVAIMSYALRITLNVVFVDAKDKTEQVAFPMYD